MTIKTLNKALERANLAIEEAKKIQEDAVEVVALTNGPKNSDTVFSIPAVGVSFNTLSEKIKVSCGVGSRVEQTGDTITITTNNPIQAQRILKLLRVSVTIQGDILNNPMTDNPSAQL